MQLCPSLEYSPLVVRWTGQWPGLFTTRIPCSVVSGDGSFATSLGPRSLFEFLFSTAPRGGGEFSLYFGVMPFLLALIGIWKNWRHPWVKYLTGLAVAALFYSLGAYSLLYGVLYVVLPYMDKAWESGRFLYLTHFAAAVLAGFGAQSLFSSDGILQQSLL